MSGTTSCVSLLEFSSAGVLLSHMVAITIAREAVLRAAPGDLPGIPAPETLRLRDDGRIDIAGPTARNEVRRAARLLSALLSHAEKNVAAPETLWHGEAEHESLEKFISALTPFAAPDPEAGASRRVTR
jgi:hypothetical protein